LNLCIKFVKKHLYELLFLRISSWIDSLEFFDV